MPGVIVRHARLQDRDAVSDICFATGYMGQSLQGKFGDQTLFAEIHALYYLREEEIALVAEVDGLVVGYCVGTTHTIDQLERYRRVQVPRVKSRLLSHTIWRHPKTALQVLAWSKRKAAPQTFLLEDFPAHLHMNVAPQFQRQGIGQALIHNFIDQLLSHGVKGIHLKTSSRNQAALPFYEKLGFQEHSRRPVNIWDEPGVESVCFTKRLGLV